MPPRWPREPDRKDPDYRRLDDRMNFAVHVGIFLTANSGTWFFRILQDQSWPWTIWMTGGWAAILLCHGLYIFALADYRGVESDKKGDRKPGEAS
jgi:2TM domain